MNDITALYYTANLISYFFATNIQRLLAKVCNGIPIISVSQKPINFGKNICVGDIGIGVYNIYKQILIGAREAKTKYVACCEDDSIYTADYFDFVPPDDTFCYNVNRLSVDRGVGFYFRNRMIMCMCIAPTQLLVDTLELRFKKYPNFIENKFCTGFSEPGRHEQILGLPEVKRQGFKTKIPCLTLNHRPSQGGMRKVMDRDVVTETNEYWGNGKTLWGLVHG